MDENSGIAMLGAEAIAALLPHGAGMSMLDEVLSWDETSLHCRTESHLRTGNPMLADGATRSILLVEFAAQAAAVHAGLLQSKLGEARPAYVGAMKNIEMPQHAVPHGGEPLDITIAAEFVSPDGAIYHFAIKCGVAPVISGRLILSQPS